jgi:hypothetical protein
MNLNVLKNSSGFLSIVWMLGGLALVFRGSVLAHLPMELFLLIIFSWLAVGLLLAIAGLKRKNIFSKICGVLGVCIFLLFAGSLLNAVFGISRKIENIGRKDEYASRYFGAPEYRLHLGMTNRIEIATFNDAVKQFALSNGFHECRNKRYMAYSGPPLCTFKSDHAAIWSGAGTYIKSIGTNAVMEGGLRLVQYDEKFPVDEYKKLSENLINTLRSTFGERIEATVIDAEKFN